MLPNLLLWAREFLIDWKRSRGMFPLAEIYQRHLHKSKYCTLYCTKWALAGHLPWRPCRAPQNAWRLISLIRFPTGIKKTLLVMLQKLNFPIYELNTTKDSKILIIIFLDTTFQSSNPSSLLTLNSPLLQWISSISPLLILFIGNLWHLISC